MTELQRYLAEEVAEDHADGLVSRREALRRLGLLGLGARRRRRCSRRSSRTRPGRGCVPYRGAEPCGSESGGRRDRRAADARDRLSWPRRPEAHGRVGSGDSASWRRARDPREPRAHRLDPLCGGPPGGERLLLVGDRPAVGGGRDGIVRGRVRGDGSARSGSSLAVRGRHEGGGDGAPPAAPGKKVAATGFCFGGGMVWLLLASKEPRLAAAVPFYGPFPEGGNLAGAKAAVLGIYAELDSRVNASRAAARRRSAGPGSGTRSSPSRESTTRSSTRPAHDTIRPRPRPRTAGW